MRFDNLQDWLDWQESLHSSAIDLGLERVQQVAGRLGIPARWSAPVIVVAGTNGKGSSVAMLEAVYHHAGFRVASYTSPHIHHYNERIRIDREPVDDAVICDAFERVDQARGETSLTYFEFGTLAALSIIHQAEPDIIVLEVGLGGRLDAVNIVDAEVALITPVDIDHQAWLGHDRETIAVEKAGIIKPGSFVVVNDEKPANAILEKVRELKNSCYCLLRDFHPERVDGGWIYHSAERDLDDMPLPSLAGPFQLQNAAAVIKIVEILDQRLPVTKAAVQQALSDIKLNGRCQRVDDLPEGYPEIIVDVSHNRHAVAGLSRFLGLSGAQGKTVAVLAMLADKDVCESVSEVDTRIDHYYLAGLDVDRGMDASALKFRIQNCVSGDKLTTSDHVAAALQSAIEQSSADDRIIVFGSFFTVSQALQYLQK